MEAFGKHGENRRSRICIIIEAALEYFIAIMMGGAYLARITSSLGFSDGLTGVLSSFVSLGCIFQLGSIRLFRNVRSIKRPAIIMQMINQLLFSFVYLTPVFNIAPQYRSALFLASFFISYLLINLVSPSKSSWLIGQIDDRERGRFTANKEIVSLVGGMLFTYAAGAAIDVLEAAGNARGTFVVCAAAILVLNVMHGITLVNIRETPVQRTQSAGSLKVLLKNRMFLLILPVRVVWTVASCCAAPFYGAYQINALGFSMTYISVMSIVGSVVRIAFSPVMGRFADRGSFSRMVVVCFDIAAAAFLVNCFTVPANGKALFMIYQCMNAAAMAGINSALSNLIYDHVHGAERSTALAVSSSLSGVLGFTATCVMSGVVSAIQQNGNRLLGMSMYPAQFVSGVAAVLTLAVIVYMLLVVIPAEKAENTQ